MQISSITNRINGLSFSGFHYNSGKKVYRDLNERIDKFEYNPNNKNLAELLNAELKVLEEELVNPEKYLEEARQGGAMDSAIFKKPKNVQEIQLQINALNGMGSALHIGNGLNLSLDIDGSLKQNIKNIIINSSEDTPSDQKLKLYALKLLKYIYNDLSSQEKKK